ncbi:hypothetical protein BDZ89DRAFT_1167747 [Hymenopellis radicata]|nr:hypothetical protein BDZ89DRAFT_1167747 [Hymenopellis radicata]
MSLASAPNFFLTRIGDELVLHEDSHLKSRLTCTKSESSYWRRRDGIHYAGYDVTIVAERWTDPKNRITSQIAGALWEWPPAVCGKHTDVSRISPQLQAVVHDPYRVFDKLQKMLPPNEYLDHGVRMRMANVFFDQVLEEMPDRGQLDKYEEIVAQSEVNLHSFYEYTVYYVAFFQIRGVRRDANIVKEHAVNQKPESSTRTSTSPLSSTQDAYMNWLRWC